MLPSRKALLVLICTMSLLLAVQPRALEDKKGAKFSLTDNGVKVDAGTMGEFTLAYPLPFAGDKAHKIVEKSVKDGKAQLKYEGGGSAVVSVAADGQISIALSGIPAAAKNLRMDMLVNFKFSQGGTWKVADGEEKPFPAQKPAKPTLYQGNADRIAFKDADGHGLALELPKYSFMQLQDNREWNWNVFAFWFQAPIDVNVKEYHVKVNTSGLGGPAKVTVDQFGQSMGSEFPGKVKSVEELKADVEGEKQWLASLKPPETDAYGGLPDSGRKLGLSKTGFFHAQEKDGRWMLVDPEGNAFFQLGICGFGPSDDYTYVSGREGIYEWLPPADGEFSSAYRDKDRSAFSFYLANRIRKFQKPFELNDFMAGMIPRVRKWGFNSGGAFSPTYLPAQKEAKFPYVGGLPLSQWEGIATLPGVAGGWDVFDAANRERVEKLMAERIGPHADDPLMIGYFLSNEPIYEHLYTVIPSLDGKFACKKKLVEWLKSKYATVEAYNAAWGAHAKSFDELTDRGLAPGTKQATQDVHDFVGVFLEEHYRFLTETFHKFDKNHLLLGSRFQPGTIQDEQLCRICGKYMDVVSFNYYTKYFDKALLDRVHGWTGNRPMLLSEFYYASPAGSGLRGGGDMASQEERGQAYRNYVEQGAAEKFVVGIEWFTLIDQATSGRFFEKYNGESANTGLISVADRPWKPMLEEMMKTNYSTYDIMFGKKEPWRFEKAGFDKPGK